MRVRSIPALSTLLLLSGLRAVGQSDEPVFHTDFNFQPIAVQVIDKQGKYVRGLAAEDFSIFEDDQPRRIVLFGGAEQPVSLSILAGGAQIRIRDLVRPGNAADEIAVLPSGTGIYDSLTGAICRMRTSHNPRQAIISIVGEKDERPTGPRLDELMRAAQDASAQIFFVLRFEPNSEEAIVERDLQRIAARAGGEIFFASSATDLKRTLDRIVLLLRSQYTLAYYPENVERFRRIEVKTGRTGAFAVLLGSRPLGYLYEGTDGGVCGTTPLN